MILRLCLAKSPYLLELYMEISTVKMIQWLEFCANNLRVGVKVGVEIKEDWRQVVYCKNWEKPMWGVGVGPWYYVAIFGYIWCFL